MQFPALVSGEVVFEGTYSRWDYNTAPRAVLCAWCCRMVQKGFINSVEDVSWLKNVFGIYCPGNQIVSF